MSINKLGKVWYKGKCLVKKHISLNRIKYTSKCIEDYENYSISDDEINQIRKNIEENNGNNYFSPSIIYIKYNDIKKIIDDTIKEIYKVRDEIAVLNLQIPLSKSKEILEELENELHYLKCRIGDICDDDNNNEETLYSDIKSFEYLQHIFEYLGDQEDVTIDDLVITIETA